MMWTTKQEDGTYRTLDTENCSMFDLILEFFLMGKENGKK